MASQHVTLSGTTRLSSAMLSLISQMVSASGQASQLKATFDTYGGDYVALAADLGITGTGASVIAQAVHNALSSAVANGFGQQDYVALMTKLG